MKCRLKSQLGPCSQSPSASVFLPGKWGGDPSSGDQELPGLCQGCCGSPRKNRRAYPQHTHTYLPGDRATPSRSAVSATVVLGVGALGGVAEEPPLPGPAPRPSPPVMQICADCGHGHLALPPVPHRRSRLRGEQTPTHPKRCESLHSPCPPGPGALVASCVILGWAGGESKTPTEAANPEHPGPPSVPRPVLGPPPTQCRRAGGNGLQLTQVPPSAGHGVATRPHSSMPGGPREPRQ